MRRSDTGNGYLYPSRNAAYGLQYGYPSNPRILRHDLQDNVLGVNTNYTEKSSGFVHSPILGWAYDGNPIYGPYGYSNAVDATSGVVRQTSSYVLKTTPDVNRPSTTKYPLVLLLMTMSLLKAMVHWTLTMVVSVKHLNIQKVDIVTS